MQFTDLSIGCKQLLQLLYFLCGRLAFLSKLCSFNYRNFPVKQWQKKLTNCKRNAVSSEDTKASNVMQLHKRLDLNDQLPFKFC